MSTFIVANWKSNKTEKEALEWVDAIAKNKPQLKEGQTVVLCPSFLLLSPLKSSLATLSIPFHLGAQDISPFDGGAYTGEVNGKQIHEFGKYVLIGHSERRKNFSETEELLEKKLNMALKYNLLPIFFVQDENAWIPSLETPFLVYEPPGSISPGPADTPENAERVVKILKEKRPESHVLYGGNVTSKNIQSFMSMEHIEGVIVGRASLDPQEFFEIIQNA